MRETTRQLVLLLGVLTLLTSGLVAWNISRTPSPMQEENQSSEPVEPEPEPPENLTGGNKTNSSQNLIEQSIRGFEIMFKDMRTAMGAVSGKSAQTP